ncbi:hypothetical protein PR202_ga15347 [Eleusine coracana subsp. coracana]|uniref:Major facilitator superfamily (MFS) profile domain-containing protein n=1 Tax=Eleusine coracana subsp. coracana TaxID=191504 RepID=A0AAV5CK55_ELECO|nr:hypothetical protein PR202_ga15347 [Eleusine coracana subsp. coracana]
MAVADASPATGGEEEEYGGRVTIFVVLSCVVACSGGFLFGYDLGVSGQSRYHFHAMYIPARNLVVGGVTSMNSFLKRFFPEVYRRKQNSKLSHYCQFNSELLTLFTSSLYIAGLLATLVASSVTTRFGRRTSMLIGGVFFIVGSAFGGAAINIPMLLLNRIFLGIGVGFANQTIPLYLAEMAPPQYRGAINSGFELCLSLGILFANIVNYFVLKIKAGWGWRISLSMAAVPAAFLTISAIFLPETPSFMIQRDGNTNQARVLLQKLRGTTSVQKELDDLVCASNISRATQHPFRNIFKRKYSPQLAIAIMTPFANQDWAQEALTRRRLPDDLVTVHCYGWSWGPLTYLIPAEVCPLEIRSAGQSIVIAVNFFMTFVIGQTFLAILCHIKSATFAIFGVLICLMTVLVYLFLPETKKVPIEQMNQVWRSHWFWKNIVREEEEEEEEEEEKNSQRQ